MQLHSLFNNEKNAVHSPRNGRPTDRCHPKYHHLLSAADDDEHVFISLSDFKSITNTSSSCMLVYKCTSENNDNNMNVLAHLNQTVKDFMTH